MNNKVVRIYLKIGYLLINIIYVFVLINNPISSNDNFIKKIFSKFESKKDRETRKNKKKKLLTIIGVDNKEVLNAIHNQLTIDIENPTQMERKFWIEYNTKELYKILYSFGYFDATIEPLNSKTIKKFKIKLNTRYKLNKLMCIYDDYREYRAGLTVNQVFRLLGIKKNTYFSTKKVSAGIKNLKDFYRRRGFAFITMEKPEVEIDYQKKTVKAIYHINLGAETTINDTIINVQSKKNPKALEQFIRNRLYWKKEDLYNIDKINDFKENLIKYDLFATIEVNAKEPLPDNDNNIYTTRSDIVIDANEALLREISAGVKFNTEDLLGFVFNWKHHNIDGRGSSISLRSDIDKNNPTVIVQHNIYDLILPKQCLSTKVFGVRKNTTSYTVNQVGAESIIWQSITKHLDIGIGGNWELSKTIDKVIKNNTKKEDKYINTFGIPIGLKFDNTDSLLDPQKGIRFDLQFTPYFINKSHYNVVLGKFSTYIGFKSRHDFRNKLVIALFSKYGTILNKNNIEIPRNRLFFSGGNNSIRGYGNNKIGPLDNDTKKPTGGTSVFEIGIEPRFRLNNNICLTAFVEAGTVFDKFNTKNIFKNLMYGWGVGLVYYTPIAPVRVNIAFPTKRRKNNKNKYTDAFFQIYISIGQAF